MRFTKVFTLTVHRFPKLLRETCQVFFRSFFPLSRHLAHRSQVTVQPVHRLLNELMSRHEVAALENDMAFVLRRRSQ